MKQMTILATAMALLMTLAAAPAMAADATLSMDVKSAYVWRGITVNNTAVIQPSIDVSAKNGFGLNVWGNYDIGDMNNTFRGNDFSEVDLTAYYNKSIGWLNLGGGIIDYLFPNTTTPSTTELYLSVGVPIAWGLSTSLTGYYDIGQLKSLDYTQLSLNYSHNFTDKLSVSAGASAGYASDSFAQAAGGKDGGLFDYNLSLSAGYQITKAWSVSANVAYVNSFDQDHLKDKSRGGTLDTHTIVGANVTYSF
jgi:uncharacterized protein (TIGR02001 family)